MFQKCSFKLGRTFYLMKHRRRCQQIGFARCNFNWIQEFWNIFFIVPSLFRPVGPISLCISLILTLKLENRARFLS